MGIVVDRDLEVRSRGRVIGRHCLPVSQTLRGQIPH